MENLRVVVAGHIDHGKSTLIGRLLYETDSLSRKITDEINESAAKGDKHPFAFITDQLQEEQSRGITIDTTKVQLRMPERNYTLIDTPGHREFLKNMITGATTADAAILIVDISEGLSEQTYQHMYLISMLGIKQIIVVVNKMDQKLYNRIRFWELSEAITDSLKKLNMQIIAVIPVSAQYGDNITAKSGRMKWNTSPTLIQSLDCLSVSKTPPQAPLRFVVQCPFIADGKTTILGRVASGRLFENHQITFGPVCCTTKVISITVSDNRVTSAGPGQSVAVVLEDAANIERGQVGFNPCHPPLVTDGLIADIFWIGTEPLKLAEEIDILCGTQYCSAHIEKIVEIIDPASLDTICKNAEQLLESQIANVRIKLNCPVCVDPFDEIAELGTFAIVHKGEISGGGIVKQ